jgi:membrane-bound lytic murein transglycosylase D
MSPVGAAGLWQFMKPTAGDYGLKFNQYIDERLDPEKSTDAALRFLRRLHKTYGDWELAMAAYNCGPGNVNKAIRRAGGGKKTFWEIFPYLPKETRGYIPSMTAVIYAMHYAADHNIFSDSILYQPQVAYLEVTQELDIEKLAWELHTTPEEIMALNPEVKHTIIPKQMRDYKLRIPAQRAALLASAEDRSCILLASAPTHEPVRKTPDPTETPVMLASAKSEQPAEVKKAEKAVEGKKVYTVQPGDNLTQIASRHQVTIAELKEWNKLSSSNLQLNQKLVIYAPATEDERQTVALASSKAAKKAAEAAKQKQVIHHVEPGDTLWTISRKYDGITIEQIKKLNKLKSDNLKPGQKLILS